MCEAGGEQSLESSRFRGLTNQHLDSGVAGEADASLVLGD